MKYSAKEAIRVAVLTEPSKKWPTYDGKMLDRNEYVTASEATSCVRKLAFEKIQGKNAVYVPDFWESMTDEEFSLRLKAMNDTDSRGIFARGNTIESWIVSMLQASRTDFEDYMFLGGDQRSFYSNAKRISGTPDGLYINHETRTWLVLEFKSTQNPISSPKYAHVNQLRINMGLIQSLADRVTEIYDVPLSSYKMESGILLYVDACNYLTMQEFEIEFDNSEAFQRAFAKAKALFVKQGDSLVHRAPEDLKPEGLDTPGGCYFCDKKAECQAIELKKQDTANVEKLRELTERAAGRSALPQMPTFRALKRDEAAAVLANYAGFKKQEKEAKKNAAGLKDTIKKFYNDEGFSGKAKFQIDGDVFEISLSESERKGALDAEKLDEKLAEIGLSADAFRKPPTSVERLTVKVTPDDAFEHYDLWMVFDTPDDEDEDDDE